MKYLENEVPIKLLALITTFIIQFFSSNLIVIIIIKIFKNIAINYLPFIC